MTPATPFSFTLAEPNEVARLTDWDLDFRQLSAGPGKTDVAVRAGPALTAISIQMPCTVHQVGAPPAGLVTFGLPSPGSLRTWLGGAVPREPLVCFGTGQAFEGVSDPGFRATTLSMSQRKLERLGADFGLDLAQSCLAPGVLDLACAPPPAQRLSSTAALFVDNGERAAQPGVEDEIGLALLIATASPAQCFALPTPRTRDRVLRRALDAIEAATDDPPAIRDLCVACDTSWPTLRRAFVERFGIGPKTYLMHLRLNRVRADLLSAPPGTRVADIANRWGFWHMGDFAMRYRALFNRLPSSEFEAPRGS